MQPLVRKEARKQEEHQANSRSAARCVPR
jgi:hypothetical protein